MITVLGLLIGVGLAQVKGPTVIARLSLKNQTVPIPTTTIFIPKADGLYRLSVYMTVTTADLTSSSFWSANVNWTDEAGAEQKTMLLYGISYSSPPNAAFITNDGSLSGPVITMQAKADTPVTFCVTQNGSTDNSAYAVFIAAERLF